MLRDRYVQPTGELDDSEDELDTPGAKSNRRNRQSHKDKMVIDELDPPTASVVVPANGNGNGNGNAKEVNGSGSASMDISESSTTVAAGEESSNAGAADATVRQVPNEDVEISESQELIMGPPEDPEATKLAEPVSPSAAGPGLSMNAFGRPKMSAVAVDGGEEMDIDNVDEQQLPGGGTYTPL